MKIERISLIGMGALGVLFGHHISKRIPNLRIVADQARIERYENDGVFCNGERCRFHYVTPEESAESADLIIFAVKFNNLDDAIEAVRGHVGEQTILLSLLNGISSEEVIGQAFGMDKVVYCVAQGMDAVKIGNRLTYVHRGQLCFGDKEPGVISDKVHAVDEFFNSADIPHTVETQMSRKLWGKFMVNVGVNQVLAVYGDNYASVQKPGERRDMMIAAMREVMALSEKEGVFLTDNDLNYWLGVIDGLNPQGKPSMLQDVEAKRVSELELFAGTVLRHGEKHGIEVPMNAMLNEKMRQIESEY